MSSTWLYLIRHGAVQGGPQRFYGHTDVSLSQEGEAQLAALGATLTKEEITAVYASDLSRSRRSAELVAAPLGLTPVIIPAFREMAMGRWEDLTHTEITARDPERFLEWMANIGTTPFPDGESLVDLRSRVIPALATLLERHAGDRFALVAHGGPNRVILCEALGLPLDRIISLTQDYGALNLIEYRDDRAIVHRLNHIAAWPGA